MLWTGITYCATASTQTTCFQDPVNESAPPASGIRMLWARLTCSRAAWKRMDFHPMAPLVASDRSSVLRRSRWAMSSLATPSRDSGPQAGTVHPKPKTHYRQSRIRSIHPCRQLNFRISGHMIQTHIAYRSQEDTSASPKRAIPACQQSQQLE